MQLKKKEDECAVDYLMEKKLGIDHREKVSITKQEENFVVVIEAVHHGMISVGSGVLVQYKI